MLIFKNLKQTLSGSLSFIKIQETSIKLVFLLIFFNTPAYALTADQKSFVNNIDYCLDSIYKRIDKSRHINKEIIIAMAALESDWGRSRFAKEGLNFFGIRTFDLNIPHIKPNGYKNPKFGLRIFPNFCASVAYTIWTLNDHHAHKKFSNDKKIENLTNWATDPKYIDKLKKKIVQFKN
jgi:uncharacterized FlgJ-related protein